MPGVYGYVKKPFLNRSHIESMTKAMKLYNHFIQDEIFEDERIAASRVHLGQVGEKSTPYHNGDIWLWIEGEAYNLDSVSVALGLSTHGFAGSLVEAYQSGKLDKYLHDLDGYFCALLYDVRNQTLKLISDRYGMRMLYWYFRDGVFAWSSEAKGILALDCIDKSIDPTSLECFMDLGYLMGEHTWFENIKLIKPATVMDLDIAQGRINQHYYWKWSEIKPSGMPFAEAVDELGKGFIEAVERRFNPKERIGISLSGGLDSRSIFAAVNQLYPDYKGYASTFGISDCDDIRIAQRVVSRSAWQHQIFYFDEQSWFEQRFEKVWNTDGMQDMMHMHGIEFIDEVSKNIAINLNGYGGSVLGGTFINSNAMNERASEQNVKRVYQKHVKLADIGADFYDINHIEPFIYMNRVRRFTNMGTVNGLIRIDHRKPLYDNRVMEMAFSLPDEYRFHNRLYAAIVKKYFKRFFIDIPWQRTGKPVGVIRKNITIPERIIRKLKHLVSLDQANHSMKKYTDYPNWIRSESIVQKLSMLLKREGSFYSGYTEEDYREKYLLPHLSDQKIDNSRKILRAATIEIYFRRLRNEMCEQCSESII